ncbi:MAG TPA: flavodoxin family protein [Armatimonadota bacterium]|nr:flavodoxin family protein [Armatimonadota bacterium]
MNILIISGSRNPEGQTAQAAKVLIEGIGDGGGKAELVFLPPMHIERCRQCENDGWGICRSEGQCIIEDDLASLVGRIKAADAVVFATPVYFSDLSECLKAFLDRLRRTCVNENGRDGIDGRPAFGICVAGGGGGGSPACTEILDRTLRTCGFDVVDVIPVRRQNLEAKKAILRSTGARIATQ